MQPETNQPNEPRHDSESPLTAGELARRLKRSPYGVRNAIRLAGIRPVQVLGRISYYDPGIERVLAEGMRAANLQPLTR